MIQCRPKSKDRLYTWLSFFGSYYSSRGCTQGAQLPPTHASQEEKITVSGFKTSQPGDLVLDHCPLHNYAPFFLWALPVYEWALRRSYSEMMLCLGFCSKGLGPGMLSLERALDDCFYIIRDENRQLIWIKFWGHNRQCCECLLQFVNPTYISFTEKSSAKGCSLILQRFQPALSFLWLFSVSLSLFCALALANSFRVHNEFCDCCAPLCPVLPLSALRQVNEDRRDQHAAVRHVTHAEVLNKPLSIFGTEPGRPSSLLPRQCCPLLFLGEIIFTYCI